MKYASVAYDHWFYQSLVTHMLYKLLNLEKDYVICLFLAHTSLSSMSRFMLMGLIFTKNKDRDLHLNPSRNMLIFPTIHSTTLLFVDFLLIKATMKDSKIQNKNLTLESSPWLPTGSTNAFHSINLFMHPRLV